MGVVVGIARSQRGPVPGLMIELFSVPEDFGALLPIESRAKLPDLGAVRLGSAISDSGGFKIEYGKTTNAKRTDANHGVNLWLIASSYGTDGSLKLVYQEPEVRLKAGAVESFVVHAPDPSPEATRFEVPQAKPEDIERDHAARREITGAFVKTAQVGYGDRTARRQDFHKTVAGGLLADISTVVREPDGKASDKDFLEPGAPVREAAEGRIKAQLEETFQVDATKPLELLGRLSLTQAQVNAIRQRGILDPNDGSYAVDEEDVHVVLSEGGGSLNPVLGEASMTRSEVVQNFCRPPSQAERCLADAEPGSTDTTNGGTAPGGGGAGAGEDPPLISADELRARLPNYVAALLDERSVLDGGLAKLRGPGEQLSEDEIRLQASFPSLSLPPGPADTPAFYDFHKLQIAFKPLWTEALDGALIADAAAVYDNYVELGGDINALGVGAGWAQFLSVMGTVVSINNPPPVSVAACIEVTAEEWNVLPAEYRARLEAIASKIIALQDSVQLEGADFLPSLHGAGSGILESILKFIGTRISLFRAEADRLIRYARSEIERRAAAEGPIPAHRILSELKTRALSQYPATYFAANRKERSVNFGLMVTYRQCWEPTAYQVGELIKSIPLAPGETCQYTKKVTIKEKRSQKEVTSNLSAQKDESKSTSRAEAEIVKKAQQKTNFSATVEGSFKVGIYDVKGSNTLSADAQADSAETKKSLHEASAAAAREYKNEFKVELEVETSMETQLEQSGRISNENNEITVNFLFYELQRRFKVTERLHRLQSVVLVAQEMPQPSEIDEDWLIANRWILNRVLLDDSFKAPLVYVAEGMAAEEHSLTELKRALNQQRKMVDELKGEVVGSRQLTENRYGSLQASMERSARATQRDGDSGGIFGFVKQLTSVPIVEDLTNRFIGADDESADAARVREAAARDAYERELERLRDLESRLAHENNSLATITRQYADRLSAHLANVVRVAELQNHIKDNIIHYMQAIWLHEPPDQRWLRLKDVPVPDFEKGRRRFHFDLSAVTGALATPSHLNARTYSYRVRCGTVPVRDTLPTRPLIEVADLDALMGFKANYMIFALKKANALTSFMMEPYVEQAAGGFGITDPDDLGNISLEEFGDYVCCLRKKLTTDEFAALKETLEAQLATLLQAPLRDGEEIIVPLDAMYIEALPGSRPILENFKLLHRQIDAADAQENLRLKKMEKLRYAQRLLAGELDDPSVTANYTFEGAPGVAVSPPSPGGPPPP